MKNLRKYIRNLLIEMAMKKPSAVAGQGLALAHHNIADHNSMRHFILFDPEKAMIHLQNWLKTAEDYNQSIGKSDILAAINNATIAVMEIKEEPDGTWSGSRTAANSGWGPTMYELMLMIAPLGFTSDRSGMSSEHTWGIWEKYMMRSDVQKIPLENKMENTGAEWQNYIFKIKNDGSPNTLTSKYDQFLKKAIASHPNYSRKYNKVTKDNLALFSIVGNMFGQKYREAGYFGEGEDW